MEQIPFPNKKYQIIYADRLYNATKNLIGFIGKYGCHHAQYTFLIDEVRAALDKIDGEKGR